jgi:serine/threonine protein kinase
MDQLTRFRRCKRTTTTNDYTQILNECSTNAKGISLIENGILGSGTFGSVFLANYNGTQIAIKVIKQQLNTDTTNDIIESLLWEVEYSYQMASQNIGPKIYDAFYTFDEESNEILCFILMEKFDGSVEGMYAKGLSAQDCVYIHTEMLKILHAQIFENKLLCSDIKPENFVIKKDNHTRTYKVRMIDFGAGWCKMQKNEINQYLELFYVSVCIQLCMLIYLSLRNYQILRPFFEDPIIKKYFKSVKNNSILKQGISYLLYKNDLFVNYYILVLETVLNEKIKEISDYKKYCDYLADEIVYFMLGLMIKYEEDIIGQQQSSIKPVQRPRTRSRTRTRTRTRTSGEKMSISKNDYDWI